MAKAVIFDVDGTIIDSMGLHLDAWVEAFRRFSHRIPLTDLQKQFGRRADFFVRHFAPEADDRMVVQIVDEKRRLYRGRIVEVKLFPGVVELFRKLRESGLKVALATSASRTELDYYIERFDLGGLIDGDISGDEIVHSKPHPEILRKILGELGVSASEAVYVGDSPHDMAAARSIGAFGIGVLTGGYQRSSLEKEGAVRVYRRTTDIPWKLLASFKRG
ncbi:MAG: HAD family hydrolase [Actinobacteria bacterium]|nr:HAD family hydrolase [Actinomycetota bacterium]